MGGKGKSVKLKKVNDETFEMVIVVKSTKQTFKVYGSTQGVISATIFDLRKEGWNVQDVLDISGVQ